MTNRRTKDQRRRTGSGFYFESLPRYSCTLRLSKTCLSPSKRAFTLPFKSSVGAFLFVSGLTQCLIRSTDGAQRGLYDHNNDCFEHVADSFTDLLLLLVFTPAELNIIEGRNMMKYCRENTKLASHDVPNQSRRLSYLNGTFRTHYHQDLPSVKRLKDFRIGDRQKLE